MTAETKTQLRKFLLKKFPTNKYFDCPISQEQQELMIEFAESQAKHMVEKIKLKHEAATNANVVPLPCPFCGVEANKDRVWMDAVFYIQCSNTDCVAQPSISVRAKCVENKGDTVTYSPSWEDAEKEAIAKWNTRLDNRDTHARQMAGDAKKEIQPKLWKIAEHIVSEKIRLDKVPESKDEYVKHKAIAEEVWFDYMNDILFPDEEPDTSTASTDRKEDKG